jgi:hypothetical protein
VKEYQDVAKLPDLSEEEMRMIKDVGYQIHHRAFKRHAPEEEEDS